MRAQSQVRRLWRRKLVGRSRDDGSVVGEKETENMVADFGREFEEEERHHAIVMLVLDRIPNN